MRRLSWNLATTFAAIGVALAYTMLFGIYGVYWPLLPSAVAGLIACYAVSTNLGAWVHKIQLGRFLLSSLIIGVDVALAVLLSGVVAIALTYFVVDTIIEVAGSPAGQSLANALVEFGPDNARDSLLTPLLLGSVMGAVPALFLGLVYGITLRIRFDRRRADVPFARRRWAAWTTIGTVLFASLLYVSFIQAYTQRNWVSKKPIDLPVAIGGCGTISLPPGVLAYCPGVPCEAGQCQWGVEQDAVAVYVEPPAGSNWTSTGGGMGNTHRTDVIQHNMNWRNRAPGEHINDNTPMRFERYHLRFYGNEIQLGDQRFPFAPGMLIVIRYSWDWSITAGVGREALNGTNLTIADLQRALDESCASRTNCEKAFQFKSDN